MRKYIVGFIVGAALTFAVQAGAASLLGSTIDAVIQVEVDGENLGQAPVIDGTSYLPVRKLGDAAGYEVSFGEGKATLTSVETEPVVTTSEQPIVEPIAEPVIPAITEPDNYFTLETIDEAIKGQEGSVRIAQMWVTRAENEGYGAEEKAKLIAGLDTMEKELERLKAIKTELLAK